MASADVDGDGRIDFLVTNQRASSTFYKNESKAGQFVGLDIRLTYDPVDADSIVIRPAHRPTNHKGRPAIGATVKLKLPNGDGEIAAIVAGGAGFGGKKSPTIHIGLGHQTLPTKLDLEVNWRDLQGEVHKKTIRVDFGWQTLLLGSEADVPKREE